MKTRIGSSSVLFILMFILLCSVKNHANAGTAVLDEGIRFSDGTVQTTSASSVTGLWSAEGENIYYTAGNVAIGATNTYGRKLWVQGSIYMMSGTASLEFKNGLAYSVIDSRPGGFDFQSQGNSKMVIDEAGKVGINTITPSTILHVKNSLSGDASLGNHVAAFENTSTGASPDVLMLKVNKSNPGNTCNFITFADSTQNLGSIEGTGGSIQLNTSGGDFAEYLMKANPNEILNSGDIVGLFPEGVSKKTKNAQRLMVVTTAPAVLGNRPLENEKSAYAPVAFLGQVPINMKGAFSAGDFIIPSGFGDGIAIAVSPTAIKPSQYASVIGRTLTSKKTRGAKEAIVMVGLPQNELWNGIIKNRDARIAKLEKRLAALEVKGNKSLDIGLLPGAGILVGSLGFFWVHRRRKDS